MDISSCTSRLLAAQQRYGNLPEEVLVILRSGSNVDYLDRLSELALDPQYTTIVFTTHEPIFVEVCSRWLAASGVDVLSALATLARILPLARYLSIYAKALLDRTCHGPVEVLRSRRVTALSDLPYLQLHTLLLALCRLLIFDNDVFASSVQPSQLQLLLTHENTHIRYLAIRILCLYLHASDATLGSMVQIYIGEAEPAGPWEEKIIDYTFLLLWEKRRLDELDRRLRDMQGIPGSTNHNGLLARRVVELQDLSKTTTCVGGILLPRLDTRSPDPSSLIETATTGHNVRSLAEGLRSSKPLLVTGLSGAGKTLLIRELAKELGQSSSMVTVHLNEQTDAKLLVGMYTSDTAKGSFSWHPGVLTTAVMEGRWVIIEDLDKAPKEIMSILLPLLKRRELLIPNWGETIPAGPGFRLIATVRSVMDNRGEECVPTANMIGIQHWQRIALRIPLDDELAEIALSKFPVLHTYMPRFMDVYRNYRTLEHVILDISAKTSLTRSSGPRNFLRWCQRVKDLLVTAGINSGHESISETIFDQIFLEAIDCFCGSLPPGPSRVSAITFIAQSLHISAERVAYCLTARKPDSLSTDSIFRIGRCVLPKRKRAQRGKHHHVFSQFALTKGVLRTLESVAIVVKQAEPCLLVGETGAGKTTIVQQLAEALNQSLTVINLSQQSEAGDLLGGYKPVDMWALAIPIKDEFDDLMSLTFPSKRNQAYVEKLAESISHARWPRALKLCQEALRMFEVHLMPEISPGTTSGGPQPKKRKLRSLVSPSLRSRWDRFAIQVQTFQNHLTSGSKGFAFSFVESNLVRAARKGEWVLLDEINLASPDTLESVADLFSDTADGGPSILLTETGNIERIYAHKDFRIFGAMNPATDVGKHDLPASLRSRFTELFVEAPDTDLENLMSVVKVYLGQTHNNADVRVANDIAQLYIDIKQLVEQNRLVDGANQKPHFSLRTLTRTLVYVLDIAPIYGLRRALYEGFSMSFLTVLDRESELLLQPRIDKHILGAQKNGRALVTQIPRVPQDSNKHVQFKHYWITRGDAVIEEQPQYIITPFIERNLLNLVRATSTRRFPVLLQGPTSSGKTSMIEYLAKISGNKFVRINNHEHTDLQEYLGAYVSGLDGQLKFQDGALVRALREGHWVVLDELNLAPTDVLEALNRLLDDNRELLVPETQEVIKPHPKFMLFATQNPPGIYGGRKILSRAFRNRFLELHFDDIPEDELEIILRERSQIAPSFCAKIVAVYKHLTVLRQSERLFEQKNSFATLRDLFRWALRDADDREQLAVNGFLLLGERVRNPEERLAVKRVIEDVMKVKIDVDRVYDVDRIGTWTGSIKSTPTDVIWTKSMRRLYILVMEAMRHNEPVLLVGETGSGKTTICQAISAMMNIKLHTVNAHQNLETGDLIGSQRPIRNRASAQSRLATDLISVLIDCGMYKDEFKADVGVLQEAYEALQRQMPAVVTDNMRLRVEQSMASARALFEWVDGSLVYAMQHGDHFLVDEISLADDSVLERLNSVLEPGRTLFLAEKGTNDSLIKASPDFQFLATMNPGGDYGKRELSPALRNRFTEIWVPHTSDENEMFEIAQAKLAPSMLGFAGNMIEFAAWYATTYNPAAPYISIRDLLAWIQFVNTWQVANSDLALLHGAAMVYIDGLGANPASKLAVAENAVSKERQVCLMKLDELFQCDLSSSYGEKCVISLKNGVFNIGHFGITRHSDRPVSPCYSLQAPTTSVNAMKIVRALQIRKPILLEGSPGVGKTTLIAALAQAIGMPLTRINLSDQTELMDLFGSDVPIEGAEAGQFGWCDAPFLRAMQNGSWVLLDEMNLASQSVLEGLNACLDHRGQVYISELDRTFQRHANFVVFAAQNPHHQGGGRKGLPASFVNRFTVVYADTFTSEDLLIISNEIYPNIPPTTTETILGCVSTISQLIQHDRVVGAHGSPWEINLRDVLRWLDLLTSHHGLLPFAKPDDFLNLLFLQRFRTPEDVAAVSQSLRPYFPQDSSKNKFHCKVEGSIEVGMGLLPRDRYFGSLRTQPFNMGQVDISIVESVMLCIQNNWPCLLVGASGSGKNSLIHKLADLVGVNVVDVSLNPEMDTMDLVGGYEQQDPKRQVASLIKRLQEYARQTIIQQLAARHTIDDNVAELITKLQVPVARIADISQLLHSIAKESPSSEYSRFWSDCVGLTQQISTDNRARFEWVDGILVKALKQGRWLILDNANLCSPSVLDRLNSLLEPNGFLSINEHRKPDGSADIVRPHPAFRLFMTMDPRHGELSRAMRNRSVELFMPMKSPSPKLGVLSPGSDSITSRFELFQAFDWGSLDDALFVETLAICFEYLTFHDLHLCPRWQTQVAIGLNDLSPQRQAYVASFAKMFQQMVGFDGMTLSGIRTAYRDIGKGLESVQDFEKLQTINPFNNSILLSATANNAHSRKLLCLGSSFELLLEVYRYGALLALVAEKAKSKPSSHMSRLERSLLSTEVRRFQNETTQPLAVFLQDMGIKLRQVIDAKEFGNLGDRQEVLPFAREVLSYLQDIVHLTSSQDFDEAVFQSYLTIGKWMCARGVADRSNQSLSANLASTLGHKLDTFDSFWQLYSGLRMEQLWIRFRPATASDMLQLELSVKIKDIAGRFDSLKWRSGASVQELDILRSSLVRIHATLITPGGQNFEPLEEIGHSLDTLGSRSKLCQTAVSPYFQAQFEMLCQYSACAKGIAHSEGISVIDLLAGRSTASLMEFETHSPAWQKLSQLQRMTAAGQQFTELAAIRRIMPVSMLCKLDNISEISLQSLGVLSTEMDVMTKLLPKLTTTMSSNTLSAIKQALQTLIEEAKTSMDFQVDSTGSENIKSLFAQLPHRRHERTKDQMLFNANLDDFVGWVFQPQRQDPSQLTNQSLEELANVATTCVQFFTGCLLLYVPNRPFDPALKPMVERSRYQRRKAEIEMKLQALQNFGFVSAGHASSFRTELLEQRLQALGEEPEVPSIVRPGSSELGQLQTEFNNILSTIVLRSPGTSGLSLAFQGEASEIGEIKVLRVNIAQAIGRLSDNFRAYEDITRPLIAFLQGLDMGLAFTLLTATQPVQCGDAISFLCTTTPFLGASLGSMRRQTHDGLSTQRTGIFEPRFHLLHNIVLLRNVQRDLDISSTQTMFQCFHSLYEEWNKQLSHDQQDNALKSSLYRYRGSQDDSSESQRQEFLELFPDYSTSSDDHIRQATTAFDPRTQACRLAALHQKIFQRTEDASQSLLAMIRGSSQTIAGIWRDDEMSKSPVPEENLLSAVMLGLNDCNKRLRGLPQSGDMYNFYADANLSEAQKIIYLVQRIQAKFLDLQEAWPEHATLGDVLRTSSELLALRHTEPLAKLLTKVEQLHGFVHEWQVVASREFTAISLYDHLTDIIMSWRRLELSTWARLLDMEDQKCKEDADSWWFIAYEVIIAVPLSMSSAKEDMQSHAEGTFSTLAEFLTATSIGQYAHRLGMVDSFRKHVKLLVSECPLMDIMYNALGNFLNYYRSFEALIQESLSRGRQALEKEIKEMIPKFKDTNINALRESAKRSHHKLFKVVRKYVALLAQPSGTVLTVGYPADVPILKNSSPSVTLASVAMVDSLALRMCKQRIVGWETKPERIKDPGSTSARMLQMSQLPSGSIDAASYIDSFATDLTESIKTLQNETPVKPTVENSGNIKHLKARKRNLYAETLKDLRKMGFQSNMSAHDLAKQASLSIILTNSPTFAEQVRTSDIQAAEYYFHKVLNIMPHVKERSRNHSEDLTRHEVTRSIGYLDSMISLILQQRSVIATGNAEHDRLDKAVIRMRNTWAPGSYKLKEQPGIISTTKKAQSTLRWLPGILQAGSVIIEKHAELDGTDASEVIEGLTHWKNRVLVTLSAFDDLPELPTTLTSSRHVQTLGEAEDLLRALQAHLQQLIQQNPALGFVVKELVRWTELKLASCEDQANGQQRLELNEFDQGVSSVLDSILVAIQHTREACMLTPTTDEDTAWLYRMEYSLTSSHQGLHTAEVNRLLESTLANMQRLSADDDVLEAASAVCAMAMPILEQYRIIQQAALARHLEFHRSLCRLASLLAQSFSQIAVEGFCTPRDSSDAQSTGTEKLEGGTGLGEGVGAEDISKDVQDDEDLSELAQQREREDKREKSEDQKDAVNMDHDDLEGEIGELSDRSEDEDGSDSEGEGDDLDEETGQVDSLDPTAVDEKLWDGKAEEKKSEKEGSNLKGKSEKREQEASDSTAPQDDTLDPGDDEDEEASQGGTEQGEEIAKEDTENIDPHTQDVQQLDLPDEMDLENVKDKESDSGDADMDEMSDIDQELEDEETKDGHLDDSEDNEQQENAQSPGTQAERGENIDEAAEDAEEAGSPVDTEPGDAEPQEEQGLLRDYSDNAAVDQDNIAPSDVAGLGEEVEQQANEDQSSKSQAQASRGTKGSGPDQQNPEAVAEDGRDDPTADRSYTGQSKDEIANDNSSSQAFKKLGDALERWHRRQRQIQDASEQQPEIQTRTTDVDMADGDFEHLQDEEAKADTQALGAATDDQARALDENAMELETYDERPELPTSAIEEQVVNPQDQVTQDTDTAMNGEEQGEQSRFKTFIADNADRSRRSDQTNTASDQDEKDMDEMENDLLTSHIDSIHEQSSRSVEEARQLWSHYAGMTRDLSMSLTEQLRLILAPTLATKMRGDFRTGKRLNMKRIIPYIASQYKRDKIWMRRSIPSKRNYQIMLAVDDSKSMGESGSGQLAFETLALVASSLTMLEAGEISIISFGNEVNVAHDFGRPFTTEAGAQTLQHFTFQQTGTNVRKLVAQSILLFREAKSKNFNAGTDLWQLELIISDGLCEDHDTIRRLVRQAQEERIMIVFVIIDALVKGQSIMNMSQAMFDSDGGGVRIKRYLDGFPFPYYLVVGDVRELPGVLAQALRQWFSEVVESG